jgi:tetratricopeptide (TPR) repeat protein
MGSAHKAIEYYEQVLVIMREIGDRRGEGNALGNLGSAYFTLGECKTAVDYYKKRLAIAQEIEDRGGQGNAFWGLAICFEKDNDLRQAIDHAERALEIFTAIESPSAKTMREMLERWKGSSTDKNG